MMLSLALVVLAQPAHVFDEETPFEVIETKGDLELSGRPVPDSKLSEYRVVTHAPYPPEKMCGVIFEWATKGEGQMGVKKPKVLEDGDTRRVVYNQAQHPVAANRDYAITVVREAQPSGACRIRYWASNEHAPAKPDGWVRLEKLWGSWALAPEKGGSRLVYTFFADPGGSIPNFMVRRVQKSAARDAVKAALDEARRRLEPAP